ncbi:Parotid hormone [Rhodotorula toruloides]|nr:Parotid hormone [Rhodotorula toruloides]
MNAHAQPTAPAVNGAPPAPVHPQPSTSSAVPSSSAAGADIAQEYAAHYADLANHLLAGYTSCDFSDVQLVASLADGQQHTLALHSVVVSRSPLLRHLIQAALASAPRPTIFLNIPDPAVNANTLGLVLASLYSPTVLSHLNPEIAPSVLATATFLSLTRLANLAYEMCEAAVREAKTPEEVMRWVAYVERERAAEGGPGATTPITFVGPAMNGVSVPPSPSPSTNSTSLLPSSVNGTAAPIPATYESRLRIVLLDRITRLPSEMGAFAPATEAQAQPALVNVLKRLPFEMFKAVVEDKRFEAPGDMERFNFAKKVVAARKALVQQSASPSSPPPEFEEAVVLLFGGGAGGSAVNILRKQRKPTLWKISNAM